MATMNESLMVQIENKYHEVVSKIKSFKSAFTTADGKTQQKYQQHYDEICSRETLIRQRYDELSRRDGLLSGDAAHSVEMFFADIDQYLHQLRTELRPHDSIGWPEGQADTRSHDSIGWPEGQADTRSHDSKGWVEGYDSKK